MYIENLKKIRKTLNFSVNELADKIGIPARTIGGYERNERKMSLEIVTQLCKNLNVNANWFVTGEGDMFIQKQPAGLKDEIRQTVLEMLKNGELPK